MREMLLWFLFFSVGLVVGVFGRWRVLRLAQQDYHRIRKERDALAAKLAALTSGDARPR